LRQNSWSSNACHKHSPVAALVVIDKVAVRHEGKRLAVAVRQVGRGHHLVGDQVGQEGGAWVGGETRGACVLERRARACVWQRVWRCEGAREEVGRLALRTPSPKLFC
jgi:hypothetical protein